MFEICLNPELARRGLLFNAAYISNPRVKLTARLLSLLFVREGKLRVVGGRRGSPVQANGREEKEVERASGDTLERIISQVHLHYLPRIYMCFSTKISRLWNTLT